MFTGSGTYRRYAVLTERQCPQRLQVVLPGQGEPSGSEQRHQSSRRRHTAAAEGDGSHGAAETFSRPSPSLQAKETTSQREDERRTDYWVS